MDVALCGGEMWPGTFRFHDAAGRRKLRAHLEIARVTLGLSEQTALSFSNWHVKNAGPFGEATIKTTWMMRRNSHKSIYGSYSVRAQFRGCSFHDV
ncbi:hypothetical protein TNCV_4498051 [Trichonephila clavipes]|nr:hypothetical protein TNCV_4498051 [Trichonephila clavipes]